MSRRARLFFFRTQLVCGFILTVFVVFTVIDWLWLQAAVNSLNAGLQFWMAADNYGKLYGD